MRHGRTTANATGLLAGRMAGVGLDDLGRDQVVRTGDRIAAVPVSAVVSSPLDRCAETARAIVDRQAGAPLTSVDVDLTECDYGRWQGRRLADLATQDLWQTVQAQPSAVIFPGGESLAGMQSRAVAAIRRHDAAVQAEHGPGAVWVAVSHGDIIKSVLADALGMHLDMFQRLEVGPASVSIVTYGTSRPRVWATSTDSGDLSWLATSVPSGDAPVGGGAGAPTADGPRA
ncbi:histidine phosphatase [Brachybacterium sp. SGAir0954]|nr:histidine phosphatase [Brachybacterium sp. SGAir0954]